MSNLPKAAGIRPAFARAPAAREPGTMRAPISLDQHEEGSASETDRMFATAYMRLEMKSDIPCSEQTDNRDDLQVAPAAAHNDLAG